MKEADWFDLFYDSFNDIQQFLHNFQFVLRFCSI